MNDPWKKDFEQSGKRVDGGIFLVAKDPKYRGFLYLLQPNESLDELYSEYEVFKNVVDNSLR